MNSTTSTVPLRCPSCGEQTHKTLDSVIQDGGFVCQCGVRSELDVAQFAVEIGKSESKIKDFGRDG
jgi:transcription elongation factor Elf1